MTEIITPYQKRVIQEDKMRDFFTRVCNNGALTDFFNRHGLRLTKDGRVMDNGIGALLYKNYLDNIVIPALANELKIEGVKSHKKPTTVCHNLLQWYKAKIITDTNKGE